MPLHSHAPSFAQSFFYPPHYLLLENSYTCSQTQWKCFLLSGASLILPGQISVVPSDRTLLHSEHSGDYRGYTFFKDPALCVVHQRHSVSIGCIYIFSLSVINAALNSKWLFLIVTADLNRKTSKGMNQMHLGRGKFAKKPS